MRDFRKLEIWDLGMDIVSETYSKIKNLPDVEKFNLRTQIGRCATSIPSNIAEGCSRSSNKELNRYLEISLGSSFELETQLLICIKLRYIENENISSLLTKVNLFQKKCNAFRNKILSDY
jgi:four helix bundle protein